ncbi:hypothetical protein F5Y12DRAFT_741418 [Xylaria sp. FL1777]|nr:hypothetical protein F5Y12DRAFT_741418 [Xylaria sp. FL1777]
MGFITSGGPFAVKCFYVWTTTKDIYYLTGPNIDVAKGYNEEIILAAQHVAVAFGLERDWFHDELKGSVQIGKRLDLFLQAV